jgi:hypothetical protein
VAWTITTGMAFLAIKRRAITQHREWMVRSYVVTLAFVFFRMLVVGLDALEVGTTVERVGVAAWFCWAVPLLIAEPVLQWRKQARPGGRAVNALRHAAAAGARTAGLRRGDCGDDGRSLTATSLIRATARRAAGHLTLAGTTMRSERPPLAELLPVP